MIEMHRLRVAICSTGRASDGCRGAAMAFRIALVYSGLGGMAQALWAGPRDDGYEVVRPENLGFVLASSRHDRNIATFKRTGWRGR